MRNEGMAHYWILPSGLQVGLLSKSPLLIARLLRLNNMVIWSNLPPNKKLFIHFGAEMAGLPGRAL